MNFDLAHLMEPAYTPYGPIHALYTDWEIDPKADYDPRVPPAKQVMFLYEQIPYLDSLRSHSDGHNVVLAALGKAGFILRMRQYGTQPYYNGYYSGRKRRYNPAQWVIPAPYVALDPIKILQDVLEKYPNDTEADRVTYTIATWTEAKGDIMEALRLYNVVLGKYPKSRYVSDANAQIQNLMLAESGPVL